MKHAEVSWQLSRPQFLPEAWPHSCRRFHEMLFYPYNKFLSVAAAATSWLLLPAIKEPNDYASH